MKKKKILIITIILILIVLAVAGATFAYLFLKTDVFKSDKELFGKYMSQNIDMLNKFADSDTAKVYNTLNNAESYESNTSIKAEYSEGGEVSSPINNLSAAVNIQKDNTDKYFYADGQILFGSKTYLESEIIKDQDLYGVRFTDVVRQFITVRDDDNLEDVSKDIGVDSKILKSFMDTLDGTTEISEEIMTKDERQKIKEKYSNLVIDTISNGKFGSNKKALITYNNKTTTTSSYTVSLTGDQIENLMIQILNNLKDEDKIADITMMSKEEYQDKIDEIISSLTDEKEMPDVKITVYQQNKNLIRTVVEIGTNKITIENTETEKQLKSKIQLAIMDSETTNEYELELLKNNSEKQEDINAILNITDGEEQYSISFLSEMKQEENIQLNTSIEYKKDILTIAVSLKNEVKIGNDFEKKQTLSNNNFVLNDADEGVRKNIIAQLQVRVPEKALIRLGLLQDALGMGSVDENEPVQENEMTQVDINKFNAKFEFYTGDEVSAENVNTLLGIVKDNLGSYEITPLNETDEEVVKDPTKMKYSFKINIERNKSDEDGAKQIIEKISDKKKYKISIFYKEQNKLIDYITIDEVEK